MQAHTAHDAFTGHWRLDAHPHLRERARHAADNTIVHIRQEPLKSVLIAGAIGAAIGALFTLLGRSRH